MTWVPLELSLFPPLHVFHFDRKLVGGVSANVFYGSTAAMAGIEVGLVNHENEWGVGLQVGGLGNDVAGDFGGIQIGGFGNVVRGRHVGLQLSWVLNAALDDAWGLQLGAANYAQRAPLDPRGGEARAKVIREAAMVGVQIGLANGTENFVGLQLALWNENDNRIDGLSAGIFATFAHGKPIDPHAAGHDLDPSWGAEIAPLTWARELSGVQIGVVNVARRVRGLQLGLVNVQTRGPIPFLPIANVGF
jgi:hypothetical protein